MLISKIVSVHFLYVVVPLLNELAFSTNHVLLSLFYVQRI